MKRILMVGTGGTIAAEMTEAGLAPGLGGKDLGKEPRVEQIVRQAGTAGAELLESREPNEPIITKNMMKATRSIPTTVARRYLKNDFIDVWFYYKSSTNSNSSISLRAPANLSMMKRQ